MDFLFGPEPNAAVQRLFGEAWVPFFRLVSLLGSNWGVVLGLGIAVWLRGRRTAYALAGALAVEGVVNVVLNRLFHVPRPDGPSIVVYEQVSLSSFPSGHVTGYVTLFGFLFYLTYTLLPRPSLVRRLLLLVLGIGVVLVGASRVYMGQHWASDALAGYALGFAYLLVVIEIYRAWLQRHPKPAVPPGKEIRNQKSEIRP